MNVADVLAAMELPVGTRVDQRVPKKLLVEKGAFTAADKRLITDGIEEIHWLAALKPNTIGVPEYRDEVREYLEIAVLSVTLRPGAKVERLTQLTHRAVPYPVWLVLSHDGRLTPSLVHKRWAQNEKGKVVLEGDVVEVDIGLDSDSMIIAETEKSFMDALTFIHQQRVHLLALYQSWMDTLQALQAARLTGVFAQTYTVEQAVVRRGALVSYDHLIRQIAVLRLQATRELQVHRLVDLNLEIKRLEVELAVVKAHL